MSEDKRFTLQDLEDYISGIDDKQAENATKITELEKKLEEYKQYDDDIERYVEETNERIEKLEKWKAEHATRHQNLQMEIRKELSELKTDMKASEMNIADNVEEIKELKIKISLIQDIVKSKSWSDQETKIKELKELSERNRVKVDELKDFRHNVAMPRIIVIEKVLRETISALYMNDALSEGAAEHLKRKLGGEESASKDVDIDNLTGEKPSNNTDSKPPSCEHEWELRVPEDLKGTGHYMAFCKKCGYLRDSKEKPSEPITKEGLDIALETGIAKSARQTEYPSLNETIITCLKEIKEHKIILVEKADLEKWLKTAIRYLVSYRGCYTLRGIEWFEMAKKIKEKYLAEDKQ